MHAPFLCTPGAPPVSFKRAAAVFSWPRVLHSLCGPPRFVAPPIVGPAAIFFPQLFVLGHKTPLLLVPPSFAPPDCCVVVPLPPPFFLGGKKRGPPKKKGGGFFSRGGALFKKEVFFPTRLAWENLFLPLWSPPLSVVFCPARIREYSPPRGKIFGGPTKNSCDTPQQRGVPPKKGGFSREKFCFPKNGKRAPLF